MTTKHVVSIGGGVSSTLELPLLVIEKYGAANVDFVIAALKGEDSDLWRMVDWLEQRTGKHVRRVAWTPYKSVPYYGVEPRNYWIDAPVWAWSDIWRVFNDVKFIGNSRIDPCSKVLKRDVMKAYITDTYRYQPVVLHVGITRDEIDRQLAIRANWMKSGVQVEFDMCDVELTGTSAERAEKLLGWTPRLYLHGYPHNNCAGACVKAGKGQWARVLWYDRVLYLYHEGREIEFNAMMERGGKGGEYTILKGVSLRQFRLQMEAKWAGRLPGFDPFDGLDETPGCTFCESVA